MRDLPVRISDSAGLRDARSAQPVERLGMERVRRGHWDGVIYLVPFPWELSVSDRAFLSAAPADDVVVAASLADLADGHSRPSFATLVLSGADGTGVGQLLDVMATRWLSAHLLSTTGEVPCAPFLRSQIDLLEEFLESEGSDRASLDGARSRLIEYLFRSWPPDC